MTTENRISFLENDIRKLLNMVIVLQKEVGRLTMDFDKFKKSTRGDLQRLSLIRNKQ